MPRPAALRARARSSSALPKLLADSAALKAAVDAALQHAQEARLLEQPSVRQALFSLFSSFQAMQSQGQPAPAEAVAQTIELGLPATLMSMLRSLTPQSLLESPGCSDPSCGSGGCVPEPAPILLITTNMTTMLILNSDDSLQEAAYGQLVRANMVVTLAELLTVAASALRANPGDGAAIAGADHALGTCLNLLQYFMHWMHSGGPSYADDEDADGKPAPVAIVLAKQLQLARFLPQACALHEALVHSLTLAPEAQPQIRTGGSDGVLMRIIQIWCSLGEFCPETGINIAAMPVLYDVTYRSMMRTCLKLGVKLPASVTAGRAQSHSQLPPTQLVGHWQAPFTCRNTLVESTRAACMLLESGMSSSALGLASPTVGQAALAVVRLAAGTKADATPSQGGCTGCVLMNMALQGCMLATAVAVMVPRAQLGPLVDDATSLLVVMQVKAMTRSRGQPVATPMSGPQQDDCNSGEVDWALADAMLGLVLYAAGAPPGVLMGRVQRTAGFGGEQSARNQSVLSHAQLHHASTAAEASGAAPAASPAPAPAPPLPAKRLLRCVEGLLRVPSVVPPPRQQYDPGQSAPPAPLTRVRAAHLSCLDVAARHYASMPEAFVGPDFVSLCATLRKLAYSLLSQPSPLDPESAAELLLKTCYLVQATLSARECLLPPGQHEALGAGAFHALRAVNALLLHLAGSSSSSALALQQQQQDQDGEHSASNSHGNAEQSGSSSGGCVVVAAECVGAASRLAFSLVKAGLGQAVEASGVYTGIGAVLRERSNTLLAGEAATASRAADGQGGEGVEGREATQAPGASAAGSRAARFATCRQGLPSDLDDSLRRAQVWSTALVLLNVQLAAAAHSAQAPAGSASAQAQAAAASLAACLLSPSAVAHMESTFPGALCIASALAGAAALERQALAPLPALFTSALQEASVHPPAGAANGRHVAAAAAAAESLAEQLQKFRLALPSGESDKAGPAAADQGAAEAGAALRVLMGQWAQAYVRCAAREADASATPSPAQDGSWLACRHLYRQAKHALLMHGREALLSQLQARLAGVGLRLPLGAQASEHAGQRAGFGSGHGLMQLALMTQDAADVALQGGMGDKGGRGRRAAAEVDVGEEEAGVQDTGKGGQGQDGGEDTGEDGEKEAEEAAAVDESLRSLLEEGAPTGLMGGLVMGAVRAVTGGLQALDREQGTFDGTATAAGEEAGAGAAEALQRELVRLVQLGKGASGGAASGEPATQAELQADLLAGEAALGRFVGCCNPRCGSLDKMAESGLDLKTRGARPGVFCSDLCAELRQP